VHSPCHAAGEVNRRSMGANACTMCALPLAQTQSRRWAILHGRVCRDVCTSHGNVFFGLEEEEQLTRRAQLSTVLACFALHIQHDPRVKLTMPAFMNGCTGTCASPNLFTTRLLERVQTTDAWAAAGADLAATSAVVSLALLAPTVRHVGTFFSGPMKVVNFVPCVRARKRGPFCVCSHHGSSDHAAIASSKVREVRDSEHDSYATHIS
jgi:hypothetical protein